jgi:hypothetical protein
MSRQTLVCYIAVTMALFPDVSRRGRRWLRELRRIDCDVGLHTIEFNCGLIIRPSCNVVKRNLNTGHIAIIGELELRGIEADHS